MNTEPPSRSETSQDGDGRRPVVPYPLLPATIPLWLRRGERMGQMVCDVAMAGAALLARASNLLRQITTRPPADPPPAVG